MKKKVIINDKIQQGYYHFTESAGKNFHPDFKPEFTPAQMPELGGLRQQIYDRLPKEIPRELVQKSQTLPS